MTNNCIKCGKPSGDYQYCYVCNGERMKKKLEPVAVTPPKVEETLKNINTALWRLVNYAEFELEKKGLDPKKIRDDMFKKYSESESVGEVNPLK